jgi:hypothetical protein
MCLFTSIFSFKASGKPLSEKEMVFLMRTSKFELDITREDQYRATLKAIYEPCVPRGVNQFETAWFILEDRNPHNKNAVRVEIRCKQVGDPTPEAAILSCQHLKARGTPKADAQCQTVIRGGWISSDGRKGSYGVSLAIPGLVLYRQRTKNAKN